MQQTIEFNRSHGTENNIHSDNNYTTNLEKFNNNCRTIFEQLLTGRKLTGLDCAKLGVLEYRRRFADLKELYGIPVKDEYKKGERFKSWWLDKSFINEYLRK